jgi:sugar (pentulose or hexulose) kinase
MQGKQAVVIGTDIGTQGVRVVAMTTEGELLASRSQRFGLEGSREEQSPEEWWSTLLVCLQQLVGDLQSIGSLSVVEALSVTSTSGTMIALDRSYQPISPALMYSDPRSVQEAGECKRAAEAAELNPGEGYTAFNASSGLPKILWFTRNYPEQAERISLWAHAADYIIGKLCGVWGVTDYSNVLKTGYDLTNSRWPDYITRELCVPISWLPRVVPPGTVIGTVSSTVAELTGLPLSVRIATGMTDGCASQIASGAIREGDWNTTIGTTLVIKGVTRNPIHDPLGRIYNHKHPQGYWMPGGASNTGGDWVSKDYAASDLGRLNAFTESITPTPWIAYPLQQNGERFPFLSPQARGFDAPGLSPEERFASRMEGVAYLERLSYEMIERLSGASVANIYTAGGGSNSPVWLKIRSSVMQKPILKMRYTEGAVGAAVLAASHTLFANLEEAAARMIRLDQIIEPGAPEVGERYEYNYQRFLQRLVDAGYVTKAQIHNSWEMENQMKGGGETA